MIPGTTPQFTCWDNDAVLPLYVESPRYVAVTECRPPMSVDRLSVTCAVVPDTGVTTIPDGSPETTPSIMIRMRPVGIDDEPDPVTRAVNVTPAPSADGLADGVSVIVVVLF